MKKKISLRWGLMTTILVCWIAAMILVISIAGILVNRHYSRMLQERAGADAEEILEQIEFRVSGCMEASKKISYDGIVRNAYNQFFNDGDDRAFYRTVSQYLSGNFSRDAKFEAIFMSFWDPDVTSRLYVINQKNNSYRILQDFISEMRPRVMEEMADADTTIRFMVNNGGLYMCRNLLDTGFTPYATVTMLCDTGVILQPLQSLASLGETVISIDGNRFILGQDGEIELLPETKEIAQNAAQYSTEIDGHSFAFYVTQQRFDIWSDMPGLRQAVALSFLLVLPIMTLMIFVFYRMVTKPMRTLVEASHHMEEGERGYQIRQEATSAEFEMLFQQFNVMSEELKSQFEKSQLEQQALQQAKIKALQSQINPHFLNNTLEVINWEARMAGDDNVSEMIDALSTMLEAALDRGGEGTVSLKREMEYVEAYLTIIRKRLGERFQVERQIDADLMETRVPKLVLQPLVENAVEHDIVPRKGGKLTVHVGREAENLCLEILHEGTMTDQDRENIRDILAAADPKDLSREKGRRVGLRNVAMRLRLLYGEKSSLTVEEIKEGMVRARVVLPIAE